RTKTNLAQHLNASRKALAGTAITSGGSVRLSWQIGRFPRLSPPNNSTRIIPVSVRGGLMGKRVALAGFLHETNTFAPSKATLENFEQGGGYLPICRGEDILTRAPGVNLGISGALAHGAANHWTMVPIVWTGA